MKKLGELRRRNRTIWRQRRWRRATCANQRVTCAEATDKHMKRGSPCFRSRLRVTGWFVGRWEFSKRCVWVSGRRTRWLALRSPRLQNGEDRTWEVAGRERFTNEDVDMVGISFEKDLESSENAERFVDEDEGRAFFVLEANSYNQRLDYGRVPGTYSSCVLMISVRCGNGTFETLQQRTLWASTVSIGAEKKLKAERWGCGRNGKSPKRWDNLCAFVFVSE